MKKIMTVKLQSKNIFKPDTEIKFQVKDMEEAASILKVMLDNDVPVKRADVVMLVEEEK